MTQMTVPEPGRFVKIATVGDITAGNVLAARLRSEGIEVRVHSQAFGPYPVTVGNMAETELWVLTDRVEEATAALEPLTTSDDADRLAVAAGVYQRLERYAESVPSLTRALSGEPERVDLLFWLGAAYERTDRQDEAEEAFLSTVRSR